MSNGLFSGIDGLKEDAMEFGAVAGAAVIGHVAAGYGFKFLGSKLPTAPAWALNLGAIVTGLAVGKVASHFGFRKAGLGLATGFIAAGAAGFIKAQLPSVPLAGIGLGEGYATRNLLMGLGDGSADALYQRFLSGAPTQVQQTGGPFSPALNGAPVVVQQTDAMHPALNGAPVSVNQKQAFHGFAGGLGRPGHPLFGATLS